MENILSEHPYINQVSPEAADCIEMMIIRSLKGSLTMHVAIESGVILKTYPTINMYCKTGARPSALTQIKIMFVLYVYIHECSAGEFFTSASSQSTRMADVRLIHTFNKFESSAVFYGKLYLLLLCYKFIKRCYNSVNTDYH